MTQNKSPPPLKPLSSLPIRIARLHAKLFVSAILGLAVLALLPGNWRLPMRLLIGWDIGVALYLCLTHAVMLRADIVHIRMRASVQDEGAIVILVLTIAAALASLVAIVFELGGSKQATHDQAIVQVLLAMVTILLSWSFVHTIFTLHYAHEYYGERGDGSNYPVRASNVYCSGIH